MNFYLTLQSLPMPVQNMDDLQTLVQCADGSWSGLRPQYVTPCIQRNESLYKISSRIKCQPFHYTGWVMVEVWSYNPDMLRVAARMVRTPGLRFVSAAVPQPQRKSLFLLIHQEEVVDHDSYVSAHRELRQRLLKLLPDKLHVRPVLGNECDFLNLNIDMKVFGYEL